MKPYYSDESVAIYHGDCRDALAEIQLDGYCSLVTDPPYSIANSFGSQNKLDGTRVLQFKWDSGARAVESVKQGMRLALSLPCESFHSFCGLEQAGWLARSARENGFTPKPWSWVKSCPPPPLPGNWWPSGFELAVYGYKPGAWFGDESSKRVNVYKGDTYRHGIRASEQVSHPTQKWLPMIRYIVGAIVPPDGFALDPFMGSGTTLIAARSIGRRAIGIEKEELYCEMAVERLRQGELFAA